MERHAWLFANAWVELPDGCEDDLDELRRRMRSGALREVYEKCGWHGLTNLAARSTNPWLVGWEAANAELPEQELLDWTVARYVAAGRPFHEPLILLCHK